jgi:hypothetical protein
MATINGTAGNDELTGTSENDEIFALEGDDVIRGGGGYDRIDGGDGNDLLDYLGAGGILIGGNGADWLSISSYDQSGVFTADGGNDDDQIAVIIANEASEAIIDGGDGSDTVILFWLLGSAELTLGASRDVVRFQEGIFGTYGDPIYRFGGIKITDFAAGQNGDVIEWSYLLGASLTNWDQSANPFSTGHLTVVQSGTDALVQMDLDGGGDDYQTFITLEATSVENLTAENFEGYDPTGAAAVGIVLEGTQEFENLTGTMGDDVIRAFGSGTINGRGGADKIYGGAGPTKSMAKSVTT